MLLSEFKDRLKPFGLKLIENDGSYYTVVTPMPNRKTIAVVDKHKIGVMITYYAIEAFYEVEISKLVSIIAEFAITPIEDRVLEEKVILQFKESLYNGVRLYLNSSGEVVFKNDSIGLNTMIEWEDILSLSEVEIKDRYNVKEEGSVW